MDSQKIYLPAEVTVLTEFLDDVKGELKQEVPEGESNPENGVLNPMPGVLSKRGERVMRCCHSPLEPV